MFAGGLRGLDLAAGQGAGFKHAFVANCRLHVGFALLRRLFRLDLGIFRLRHLARLQSESLCYQNCSPGSTVAAVGAVLD